ncbi:unnamed protein product [Closterium sp. NIES-53]
MASRALVSGLPRSLPPLPPGPAPTCVPCVKVRQRAAPHSSEFPPTEAPLQTLHMDVWVPARVRGQGHERYFLLVVDDYSRYTTVFPLRSKGEVTEVLIVWIRVARLQLRERFGSDFPVLRLHSDRGESFPPTFCEPSVVRRASARRSRFRPLHSKMGLLSTALAWSWMSLYAAHQINLQPRVSLPETSPTLRWTGKVGDASAFRVWGSRAFVRDLSADKLSSRDVPCVFLGFPPDAPGWQFYHPTLRRVLSSQDVTFDESVPYYCLFPYRTAPLPPPPLFLAPGPPPVDPLPPQGLAPSGVSQRAESGGAEPGGAEIGGAGSGGAEPERAEPGGAASGGAELGAAGSGGVEPAGAGPGGPSGALSRRELPSPQELREWFARRWSRAAGAGGAAAAGGSAATGGTGAGGATGANTGGSTSAGGAGATGPGGARTGGTGAAGPAGAPSAGASGAAGVGATGGTGAGAGVSAGGPAGAGAAGGTGAGGAAGGGADAGGTGVVPAGPVGAARPRPYFVPLLEQVLGLPPSPSPAPSLACPPPVQSESQLQLASPLPAPSPYAGPTGGLAERLVLIGHADASWVDDFATQLSSQGYTFSLGSGSVSWRFTRSSSVLSSSCEVKIYAGAMAAQELRWLTYLVTDLGERPRSSPVLYVDNKAMIALCQENRLEHGTKHIALRYFLARELQQRGQLRLAYVATRANTADIFTKALQSGDHQRFCTVLGLVPTLPHLLTT